MLRRAEPVRHWIVAAALRSDPRRNDELRRDAAPAFRRIVVAIDPSGTQEGDETGIIAVGLAEDDHAYVLVDRSGQYAPTDWARHAVGLYHRLHADRIVAETHFGGGMVEATVRMVDPNVAYTKRHGLAWQSRASRAGRRPL